MFSHYKVEVQESTRRTSGGRYEIMWERHADLPGIIANAWAKRKSEDLGDVEKNLKNMMELPE